MALETALEYMMAAVLTFVQLPSNQISMSFPQLRLVVMLVVCENEDMCDADDQDDFNGKFL